MFGIHKHPKLKGSTEPEEINEDRDPFAGLEITSDADSEGGTDDDLSDANRDRDGDIIMGNTQTHDILLDSDNDPGDEDADPEDDDIGSEDNDIGFEDNDIGSDDNDIGSGGDTDPEDEGQPGDKPSEVEGEGLPEFNHGFRGAELGIVPPRPTRIANS